MIKKIKAERVITEKLTNNVHKRKNDIISTTSNKLLYIM